MEEKAKLCPLGKTNIRVCQDNCAWAQDGEGIFLRAVKALKRIEEAIDLMRRDSK